MKNRRGFTLIEIIAVIVILSIIAIMTVPIIIGIINNTRISSYRESVRNILKATDLYIASDNFVNFPPEGINVIDVSIQMKNKNFVSGKIIKNIQGNLELEKVSNGQYCGKGVLEYIVVVEGSCDQLDTTPPTITINSNLITSSSIMIVGTSEDYESGISGYQFSKNNGLTWTIKQTSNVYTFTGLTNNVDYTFKVRAINNNNLVADSSELVVKTRDIEIPTYSINTTEWSTSKIVTILYPFREEGYSYEYSLDNALTWQIVEEPITEKQIIFNENGSVIARILDGTNEINGTSYQVTNIDITKPTIEISVVGSPFNENDWAKDNFDLKIQTIDNESGINNYKYCQTTSSSCVPTAVVNESSGTVTISTESTTNKICVQTFDNVNNSSLVVCSDIYKLDKGIPAVVFGMNGNSAYAKSRNTTISVSDATSGVIANSLKYLWNTNVIAPTETSFSTSFTNGGTLTTPVGVTGGYYLWILGLDNAGNTLIARSNVFNLDNTIPVISINPSSVSVALGSTYTDTGVTASDNINGNITTSIVKTGTVNTSLAGTYTLTYNVTDLTGNNASQSTRTVTVNPRTEYRYRDSYQSCSTCYQTCTRTTTGTASYSCSSGTLSGTSCVSSYGVYSTFHATYVCSNGSWVWQSHYCTGNCSAPCSNGSSPNGYQSSSSCPPGSCTAANQGATGSCNNYWTGSCPVSIAANVTYICPAGYSGGGTSSTCTQNYSCNPYSCNCTTSWGSWSSWSTTPVTPTGTRQVETRVITSI